MPLIPSRPLLCFALAASAGCLDDHTVKTNRPPLADAGEDQQLDYAGAPVRVRLDGRASSDADGRIVEYVWRSADSPDGGAPGAALDPEDAARPELMLEAGVYVFTLWVRDDAGEVSTPDSVIIRVGVDAVAACEAALPVEFQNACGSCMCGASDACRSAIAACDDACWALVACIAASCPDTSDSDCITSACTPFLGGAAGATRLGETGCFEPCTVACTPEAPDAG